MSKADIKNMSPAIMWFDVAVRRIMYLKLNPSLPLDLCNAGSPSDSVSSIVRMSPMKNFPRALSAQMIESQNETSSAQLQKIEDQSMQLSINGRT